MNKRKSSSSFIVTSLVLLLASCSGGYRGSSSPTLVSINIVDRNGFNETISNPDRLKQYANVDFCTPQPFQRVLRVYERDRYGNVNSSLVTYHPNGQPKQYLEVVNSRAMGSYREWYQSGHLKLTATLVGGEASLNPGAEKSWLFDGECRAWDESGHLEALIPYSKGELEGESLYFHPNGQIWKRISFHRHLMEGSFETFLSDGSLLQTSSYRQGLLEGVSMRYWPDGRIAAHEQYNGGALLCGDYRNQQGEKVAEIEDGKGLRALFSKDGVAELQEYQQGQLEGKIKQFDECGRLVRSTHVKNGLKHGEEVEYYIDQIKREEPRPMLLLSWYEGKIQGTTKTWYDQGGLESQREMSRNQRNGLAMAWYRDGSLMLLEEYTCDRLVKGEYYKRGEKRPVSTILNSEGEATLFDAEGNFVRKMRYSQGKPLLD